MQNEILHMPTHILKSQTEELYLRNYMSKYFETVEMHPSLPGVVRPPNHYDLGVKYMKKCPFLHLYTSALQFYEKMKN